MTEIETRPVGRPPGPALTPKRRRELERRVAHVRKLEAALEAAREALVLEVQAAAADGVALRTIAAAAGISQTQIHRYARVEA